MRTKKKRNKDITEFQNKVFAIVKKIPKGKLTTYKKIAEEIGSPKSVRAVGNALNKNNDLKNIPCYKVIKSNSEIGGYVAGESQKIKLLKKDGIKIENNRVLDMKKYL